MIKIFLLWTLEESTRMLVTVQETSCLYFTSYLNRMGLWNGKKKTFEGVVVSCYSFLELNAENPKHN